jgi:hypothetical protein
METFLQKIDELNKLNEHYLKIAKGSKHPYYKEFLSAAEQMQTILNKKDFEAWMSEKMLIKDQLFSEKKFIQAAVETAVACYFGQKFPEGFRTEAKIRPGSQKDVDVQFYHDDLTFNIEVKCADFGDIGQRIDPNQLKFINTGRMDDRGENAKAAILSALREVMEKQEKEMMPDATIKSMDNNLWDYLKSANDKFNPEAGQDQLNVLLVGCDDAQDLQMWFNYMFAPKGLFTNDSFANTEEYELVDAIVLTNQFHKHHHFYKKDMANAWTLEDGFAIVFRNPNARAEKQHALSRFCELFPNYTKAFLAYEPSGSAPVEVKLAVWMSNFIREDLEKNQGIYLFSEPKKTD